MKNHSRIRLPLSRFTASGRLMPSTVWCALALGLMAIIPSTGVAALFVSNTGTNSVQAYDANTGAFIGNLTLAGPGTPSGFTFGSNGNLFVNTGLGASVEQFSGVAGSSLGVFVTAGSGGLIENDWGISFGPDGNLYIADNPSNRVVRCDGTTGAFIDEFVAAGAGGLNVAGGLTFGTNGNLYVASTLTDEILSFDGTSGAFLGVFASGNGLTNPVVPVFGPDGNLYVSSRGDSSVKRFDGGTGAFIDSFVSAGSGGLAGPEGLAFGLDGNLYVTDTSTNAVKQYDGSTGAFLSDFVPSDANGLANPQFCGFRNIIPLASTATVISTNTEVVTVDLLTVASDFETASTALVFGVSASINGSVTMLGDGHTAEFAPADCDPGAFTYSVMDEANGGSANTTNAVITVTAVDTEPPTISSCPANITSNAAPGLCTAIVDFVDPTTSDNCPGATVNCTPPSGASFGTGTNTVTCTAADASGNQTNCSFTVTVQDLELPAMTCPANIASNTAPGLCTAVVTFTVPTPSDNCPGVTAICAPASGSVFNKGTNTVTCTATDASGNQDGCSFDVTVVDSENPSLVCPANKTQNTDAGQPTAVVTFSTPIPSDNCPGATAACVPPSGSIFSLGTTTVNCTATDASGNQNGCSFDITVEDSELPTITCPSNITSNTAPGECTAVVEFADPTTTDNVPGVTVSCVPVSGSTFTKGTTTVTCTATDASDNQTNCTFVVTVADHENPAITCPANITTNAMNVTGAVLSFSAPVVSDNCSGALIQTCNPPSNATFTIGTNAVTCTAMDAAGNQSNCVFTVIIRGPQEIESEEVLVQLQTLRATATGQDAAELDKAINTENMILDGSLWLDDSHLQPKTGRKYFKGSKSIVTLLEKLAKSNAGLSSQLQEIIDLKLLAMGMLVDVELPHTAGINRSSALQEVLLAETSLTAGAAIGHYQKAWIRGTKPYPACCR